MSEQRLRLAKYLNKRQLYHATFSEIRHDNNEQPQVLLTDIYPVYPNGHKVPLRSKYTLTDDNGHQIAASHLWTKLNAGFLESSCELLYGDQIEFSATVETYPIVRENVVQTRKQLWKQNNLDRQKIYKQYQEQTSALYKIAANAKQKAYKSYCKHLLSFDEMKQAQNKAAKDFQRDRTKAFKACQRKMNNHTKRVQKQIQNIPMLDYTLTDVQDVKIIKLNRHFKSSVRYQYDIDRLSDTRYTKFLAAHSMFARQDKLSEWSSKDNTK